MNGCWRDLEFVFSRDHGTRAATLRGVLGRAGFQLFFDTRGSGKAVTARTELSLDDGRGKGERGSVHCFFHATLFWLCLPFLIFDAFVPVVLEVEEEEEGLEEGKGGEGEREAPFICP